MSGEQFKIKAGLDMLQVAYKGGAPSLQAAVSGEVPLTIVSIAGGAMPNIKAGKVKILAMIGAKRYPGLPNVPNLPEVVPGFEPPPTWIAFFGPAKMPKPVTDRLRNALADAGRAVKALVAALEKDPPPFRTKASAEIVAGARRRLLCL